MGLVADVLAEDPNNAEAYILSAYVHADTADYEQALEACHHALAINPLLPVARYILGIIYQRQGDLVRAVSELKKTIYIDAEFALAHLNLANIYKTQRKWDQASREYENALRALYKSPEGAWTEFLGGFKADLLVKTCERSLVECRKAMGAA
ncbi:MAG: tetratricopeptide repeat protein [Coriobacteriia bacterium]|nr:tetratricopeptide repeat protein [Coriobacteriia bacterium]